MTVAVHTHLLVGNEDRAGEGKPMRIVNPATEAVGSPLHPDAPMTGLKHSGVGSEWGEDGLRERAAAAHRLPGRLMPA
jgi:hypothetical protein